MKCILYPEKRNEESNDEYGNREGRLNIYILSEYKDTRIQIF